MASANSSLRRARETFRGGEVEAAARIVAGVVGDLQEAHAHDLRADLAHRLATYHRDVDGDLQRCEAYARQAVDEERSSGRQALLGNHLMFLATLLASTRRHEEALPFAAEALTHYASVLGLEHAETRHLAGVVDRIRRGAPVVDPARVHQWVERYRFDGALDELWPLVVAPSTELGTALMIYWRLGGPWLHDDETGVNREARHLASQLRRRLEAGVYARGAIRYDPVVELGLTEAQLQRLAELGLPDALVRPTFS